MHSSPAWPVTPERVQVIHKASRVPAGTKLGEKMLQKLAGMTVLCAALAPVAVAAECAIGTFDSVAPAFSGVIPQPPSADLRPETPDCLRGLAAPSQENCSEDEVAAYSDAVDTYVAALNAYITASDGYARAAAEHANAAVLHAQSAQAHADGVFAFVTCEAEALRAQQ